MFLRALLLALLGMSLACSRAGDQQPWPRAVADTSADGAMADARAPDAAANGRVTEKAALVSVFSIVARAPMGPPGRTESSRDIAMAMPLVQRLPGGGLVLASEYARAQALGAGPLAVDLHGRGFERDVPYRHGELQGAQMIRWVWSDASLTIVSSEEATMRSGPRVTSYKLGPNGFEARKGSVGYWSAVTRAGSVMALERTAYEVPNSGMYPKGSGFEQNEWRLRPARVALLSGKAPVPVIPAGVCPLAMSAAPDGAVIIAVDKCNYEDRTVGVLRYAPSATEAKVAWFAAPANPDQGRGEVVVFAASENEMYASDSSRLQTWNGKAWASAPTDESIVSLSRGPDGALWAVSKEGRVSKRSPDSTWNDVALPLPPSDPLEEHPYAAPALQGQSHFVKDGASEYERLGTPTALSAHLVDAAGEEVLVLAYGGGEALVLSTRPRSPVARLPSISTQRARIMQTIKPEMMTAKTKNCSTTFLMFADGVNAEAIRAKLGPSSPDAGDSPKIGEAIVEGQKRLVVYGEEAAIVAAAKELTTLAPRRACSPAVIEKAL